MTASCQASLSSDDSFFRETFPTNPPSTHQSPPVTALLVLKISLLCICLLPVFPTVSTHTSQEVRPQLFLFLVVFLEPRKFLEPNGHLNKDLLQMDWIYWAHSPGIHSKLFSVMFTVVWLEFHSDFIPWSRCAKKPEKYYMSSSVVPEGGVGRKVLCLWWDIAEGRNWVQHR